MEHFSEYKTYQGKQQSVRGNECRNSVSISPIPKLKGASVNMSEMAPETDRNELASYQFGSFSNGKKIENRYMKLIGNLKKMDEEVQNSAGL